MINEKELYAMPEAMYKRYILNVHTAKAEDNRSKRILKQFVYDYLNHTPRIVIANDLQLDPFYEYWVNLYHEKPLYCRYLAVYYLTKTSEHFIHQINRFFGYIESFKVSKNTGQISCNYQRLTEEAIGILSDLDSGLGIDKHFTSLSAMLTPWCGTTAFVEIKAVFDGEVLGADGCLYRNIQLPVTDPDRYGSGRTICCDNYAEIEKSPLLKF